MNLTAIILAGGKSSRMGADKALLKIGNKSLLETAINICKPVCNSIIISSNNPAHSVYDYPVIADEQKDCGPIGGICSCLKQSETEWNFVIGVDTPFVTTAFVEYLFLQTGNSNAVVPVNQGKTEPLVALYNKNCLPVIQSQIGLSQFKLQNTLALLKTQFIEVDQWLNKSPLLFNNLNRPEDFNIFNKIL